MYRHCYSTCAPAAAASTNLLSLIKPQKKKKTSWNKRSRKQIKEINTIALRQSDSIFQNKNSQQKKQKKIRMRNK